MTLEQLRIFIAVAEREHVTRAAQTLNLTQSATSAAIAALEARYAAKLFDRVGRRIALTAAGRLFLPEAKAVLARASAAEKVLADLAGLKLGSLTLSASNTIANYWLPAVIQRYCAKYPGIDVKVAMANTKDVVDQVHHGMADIGFVEGEIDDPNLSCVAVGDDELVLVAPLAHRWAKRKPRTAELNDGPWVVREQGAGTRSVFEAALRSYGLAAADLNVALELPSNEAILAAVEAGIGVAALSVLVVEPTIKTGRVARVGFSFPRRRFLVVRHKERYLTRAEQAFLDMIVKPPARRPGKKA